MDEMVERVSDLIDDRERLLNLIECGVVPALVLIQRGLERFDELHFESLLTGFLINLLNRNEIDVRSDCELLTHVIDVLKASQKVG